MLQNAYFLAKIGADTAENEQYFFEIFKQLTKIWQMLADPNGATPGSVV